MKLIFDVKDLVSFGAYLNSDERKASFEETTEEARKEGIDIEPTEERLKSVHHADILNWVSNNITY